VEPTHPSAWPCATGPHLHWEVRVGGVAVEPLEWTQRDDLGLSGVP
jgi:murein DD-endopeptidase MepM/ murein hydrolase activator NlpD